ncbi:putative Aryl-alcohol dehydrogenase [Seiridium cardinale]
MAFALPPAPATELGRCRILSSTAGSVKLLDAYADASGNFIDTANNYQNEQSEIYLGRWMQARKNRDLMFVATKYTNDFRGWEGNKGKTSTSIEELMDSLHHLVEQGKVLYLGISDTPAWVVAAANTYAKDHGKTQFSVYQGRWSVMSRDFERDIIPMARHFGMALCPWNVLGGGQLRTKTQLETRQASEPSGRGSRQSEEARRISAELEKLAAKHGDASIQQIALAYVIHKAPRVFPIIGGRKIEHLHDNIRALSICLSDDDVKSIENLSSFDIGFPLSFIGDDPRFGETPAIFQSLRGAQIAWK